jgi:hypothetical protein
LVPRPPSDKTDDWTIWIENVRATADELWFMEYRFAGRAVAHGSFELAPGRRLWVEPATLEVEAGTLSLGKSDALASSVKGYLDVRFREANPDVLPGLKIFRQISSTLDVDLHLVGLDAANLYQSVAEVSGGRGSLRARVRVTDGHFVPDSRVEYASTEDVVLANQVGSARARPSVQVECRDTGPQPRLFVSAFMKSIDASLDVGGTEPGARTPDPAAALERVHGELELDGADIAEPWTARSAVITVPQAFVPDLSAINRTAGLDDRSFRGGSAWGRAHARLSPDGAWEGGLRVDVRRLSTTLMPDVPLRGFVALALDAPSRGGDRGMLRDVRVELESEDGSARGSFDASARSPVVSWRGFPPEETWGKISVDLASSRWLLELLSAPGIVKTAWPDAPVEVRGSFRSEKSGTCVVLDEARTKGASARGRMRLGEDEREGAFLVESGTFSLGLAVDRDDVDLVPFASQSWLDEHRPDSLQSPRREPTRARLPCERRGVKTPRPGPPRQTATTWPN